MTDTQSTTTELEIDLRSLALVITSMAKAVENPIGAMLYAENLATLYSTWCELTGYSPEKTDVPREEATAVVLGQCQGIIDGTLIPVIKHA